jgi:D-3-phosphoglycerate dehydrogenase
MKSYGIEKIDDLNTMLARMNTSAFVINVSRGAIIDESALLAALKSGQIAGAGLDVYSEEPLSKSSHPLSELYAMDNVILLPHLTFYTTEAMHRLELETLQRCFEILEGQPLLIKSRDPRLLGQNYVKVDAGFFN